MSTKYPIQKSANLLTENRIMQLAYAPTVGSYTILTTVTEPLDSQFLVNSLTMSTNTTQGGAYGFRIKDEANAFIYIGIEFVNLNYTLTVNNVTYGGTVAINSITDVGHGITIFANGTNIRTASMSTYHVNYISSGAVSFQFLRGSASNTLGISGTITTRTIL